VVAAIDDGPACAVGSTESGSHYAMEIAAQIIAKAMYPSLNDADSTTAGFWYGYYVDLHVGVLIGASFTHANNLASQAWALGAGAASSLCSSRISCLIYCMLGQCQWASIGASCGVYWLSALPRWGSS
jgi:hypothetical protein